MPAAAPGGSSIIAEARRAGRHPDSMQIESYSRQLGVRMASKKRLAAGKCA